MGESGVGEVAKRLAWMWMMQAYYKRESEDGEE